MIEWKNQPDNINDYTAFVYIIKNLHTGKKYLGYKMYWKTIKRKPLKGYKRARIDKVQTDWKTYWGSCKELLNDMKSIGKHNFERTILLNCKSKMEARYEETRLQFEHQVLLSKGWYNNMINVRLGGNGIPDYMKK